MNTQTPNLDNGNANLTVTDQVEGKVSSLGDVVAAGEMQFQEKGEECSREKSSAEEKEAGFNGKDYSMEKRISRKTDVYTEFCYE